MGDVTKHTLRALEAVAAGKTPIRASLLKSGSHLIREWNGRSYMVEVKESGFWMDGIRFWPCSKSFETHATDWPG